MQREPQYVQIGRYITAGVELGISVVAGLMIGLYADKKIGIFPWLTATGTILGVTMGFWNLFRILKCH